MFVRTILMRCGIVWMTDDDIRGCVVVREVVQRVTRGGWLGKQYNASIADCAASLADVVEVLPRVPRLRACRTLAMDSRMKKARPTGRGFAFSNVVGNSSIGH